MTWNTNVLRSLPTAGCIQAVGSVFCLVFWGQLSLAREGVVLRALPAQDSAPVGHRVVRPSSCARGSRKACFPWRGEGVVLLAPPEQGSCQPGL